MVREKEKSRKAFLKTMEAVTTCFYFDENKSVKRGKLVMQERRRVARMRSLSRQTLLPWRSLTWREKAQFINTTTEGKADLLTIFKNKIYFQYPKDSDLHKQNTHIP